MGKRRKRNKAISEKYYAQKVKRLEREISDIDSQLYDVTGKTVFEISSQLERKRDDVVRGVVFHLHTAIEDLLDVWIKSTLLGVEPSRERLCEREPAPRTRRPSRDNFPLVLRA
jgi:predicted metallo-beta-lactamase superfamily hydrolase